MNTEIRAQVIYFKTIMYVSYLGLFLVIILTELLCILHMQLLSCLMSNAIFRQHKRNLFTWESILSSSSHYILCEANELNFWVLFLFVSFAL